MGGLVVKQHVLGAWWLLWVLVLVLWPVGRALVGRLSDPIVLGALATVWGAVLAVGARALLGHCL